MAIRKRSSSSLSPLSADNHASDNDDDFKPSTSSRTPTTPLKRTRSSRSRRATKVKKEESDSSSEAAIASQPLTPQGTSRASPNKKSKLDDTDKKATTPSTLAKKLRQLEAFLGSSPFPNWDAPSAEQCAEVQNALGRLHGLPKRPTTLEDRKGAQAGCGAVPDVLDALIRTILSQNTTSKNSTAAKNAMDEKYGRANHMAVHKASVEDLAETIAHGGLANVKSKVIKKVLAAVLEKQKAIAKMQRKGEEEEEVKQISLDYLHQMDDREAMKELVSFDGVGPKTASCVLLFCLGRNSFAVDTHVFRITKALGWIPPKANRETAFQHLDIRIPDEHKYPLHSLFVRHGRSCRLCSANGNITEKEVDSASCPIKAILKNRTGKSPKRKQGKGMSEETGDEEEEDILMPGEIEDKEEEKGQPAVGAPVGDIKGMVKVEDAVKWENFGENKDGKMHGL